MKNDLEGIWRSIKVKSHSISDYCSFGACGCLWVVMLNGFMDASAVVYAGFAYLGITLILYHILAWMMVKTLIVRFDWNYILAVVISVLVPTFLGGAMGFVSMIVMGIVAEVMWRS